VLQLRYAKAPPHIINPASIYKFVLRKGNAVIKSKAKIKNNKAEIAKPRRHNILDMKFPQVGRSESTYSA
jgi:hypothetical protein